MDPLSGSSSTAFLTQSRATSLGMAAPTVGGALPHQVLIKKTTHILVYVRVQRKQFFNGEGLSSQVCQIDNKS